MHRDRARRPRAKNHQEALDTRYPFRDGCLSSRRVLVRVSLTRFPSRLFALIWLAVKEAVHQLPVYVLGKPEASRVGSRRVRYRNATWEVKLKKEPVGIMS